MVNAEDGYGSTDSTSEAGLDQLIVSPSVRRVLELATEEQAHLNEIKSHGLTPQQTFLFTGPPGCGKTMSAAVVANSLGLPLFSVRLDAIISRYLGESLDFALFRRFDMLLEFEMPTADQCVQALELRLKDVKKPKTLNLRSVGDAAVGLSFADLSRACDDAVKRIILGKTKSLSAKLLTSLIKERKAFLARNCNR